MSSKSEKRRDFLTAFRAFFITVICCLLVFLAVALAVLNRNEKAKEETPDSLTTSSYEASSVLIVYKGSSTKFVAINFNWDELNYSCTDVPDRAVEFEDETDTLSGFLSRKGLTGLMNAYNSFARTPAAGYLVLTSDSLSKTVNRFGGLNGEDNRRITGTEAVEAAESGDTEQVFSKLAERFFSEYGGLSLKNRFLYLISVNESNLSYAVFCKMQQYLEKM